MAKTPMMQQYDEAKAACGDALLLFRMGDFYELFFEDAKVAAKVLGLTLTSRDGSLGLRRFSLTLRALCEPETRSLLLVRRAKTVTKMA